MFQRTRDITTSRDSETKICVVENEDRAQGAVYLREITPTDEENRDSTVEEEQVQPRSLEEALHQMHQSLQWVVEDVQLPTDNGRALAAKIREGKGRCMSDGSLKNTFGTSGFTSMLEKEELDYTGANRVPGEDNEQTSYRSELIGILANVVMHNAICKVHDIKDPHEVTI